MQEKRNKGILQAGIIGIIINILLGAFKGVLGFITHSVAISMDGINNLTDAGSSFITMLAAFFSGKSADRKHPFGYGRIEYLGTLIIGGLVTYAGITALIESALSIKNPKETNYSVISIVIIVVAVVVKIGLAVYTTNAGKRLKSDSLVASGKEAVGDIMISSATVVAALLYMSAGISVEGWLGVIIGLFIIKSGIEVLKETVGNILGVPADVSLVKDIKKAINEHEGVKGAYDLVLHNYGPETHMATVHIAVDDTLSINELDGLTREIQEDIAVRFGVFISAVGIYSVNTESQEAISMREHVSKMVADAENVNQVHGFYINSEKKLMRFDLVISFNAKDRKATFDGMLEKIRAEYPDYSIEASMDADFNEVE